MLPKPKIIVIKNREDDWYLKNHPKCWAYYTPGPNTITIWVEQDCRALRFHEYGHWFIEWMHDLLNDLWEVPWWRLKIRELFRKEKTNGNKV